MSFSTVGSTETLLKLFQCYQTSNGHHTAPRSLWTALSAVLERRAHLTLYSADVPQDTATPAGKYLDDLADLVRAGLIAVTPEGSLEFTAFGETYVRLIDLPQPLREIAKELTHGPRP